jgi:hypothetical protein
MTTSRIGLAGLAAVAAFAFTTSEASAQYLPPQTFAPGYGAYYNTYPTPNGGVVNRTSYTTPYGTTYTKQYANPYTGYSNSAYSYSPSPFGSYNYGLISPSLYYGPTYGGSTVVPYYYQGYYRAMRR